MPVIPVGVSNCQFVSGYVERGSLPTVCCFDLNQAVTSIILEAKNVVARTIAILNRCPPHFIRQVFAPFGSQSCLFVAKHKFFPRLSKRAIAGVPFCYVKFSRDLCHEFSVDWWRLV